MAHQKRFSIFTFMLCIGYVVCAQNKIDVDKPTYLETSLMDMATISEIPLPTGEAANKIIYFLTGLGADESVFKNLHLPGYELRHISWITPLENETITSYASRLRQQVTTPKPIIVGLSFGGMIATEIAKQMETEKVFLLASAKTKSDLPFYYRFAGKINLHNVLNKSTFKNAGKISYWLFGANSAADRAFVDQALRNNDERFSKWAINAIVHWNNTSVPANTVHIHGSADRVLPVRFSHAHIIVPGGGHLMPLNKPETISKLILQEL